ncbi:preprotein translocase subunit SecD [Halorubrum sp. JWXQ-INN 858]|uniref:preprotein translocase subunit SecD n=1 Tax=Halorubrum sp. JWXQ-INN 858 TaxID=2690782 RepID=UPI00135BD846|nr:preprotein translocase subunit SecD [Halorubrum sp. JWXQ-INN 858]MWV63795.1 preprotein translocase subunit SecD [Halorubrum sp. JWXQ-INN 858]
MLDPIKKNWRVLLLVVVIVAASIALFAPQFAPDTAPGEEDADARQGLTNLQYGLDLAGGTRVRAPLLGYTATGVEFDGDNPSEVASNVAAELDGVSTREVNAERLSEDGGEVEVTDPDVTEAQFRDAMDASGYAHSGVRAGVTEETRNAAVRVIEGKINEAGLSGGSVQQVQSITGEWFVLVEVPGEDRQDVIELLEERGTVQIDIAYPDSDAEDGLGVEEEVLVQQDFENIGTAGRDDQDQPYVPVSVINEAPEGERSPAERFQDAVVDRGVATSSGGARCTYMQDPVGESNEPCLLLVVDGEVVNAFGMNDGLAESMVRGSWADTGNFRLTTTSFEDAQQVSINLRAGALPAELDIEGQGTSSTITASQGEDFRVYSMITGLFAIFAVAGMVFLRYREPKVALPMIVTALAEVYALLGFAALVGYPIELAVIAGFIAVVGTGVDDLVIIADEVMSEGDVNSRKVFDSRFRRAFWVIGAAAATTIIAMSPLMVLSLGDLSGFAIFTILGVLIGVLITRPAYGDILRRLLTVR